MNRKERMAQIKEIALLMDKYIKPIINRKEK